MNKNMLIEKLKSEISEFGDGTTEFHTRDIAYLIDYLEKLKKRDVINYLGLQDKGVNHNRIDENKINEHLDWNNPEKSFSFQWQKEQSKNLSNLLMNNSLGIKIKTTPKTRIIAATIIQWLGSNIGMNFLKTVLKEEGYEIKKIDGNK